jgi:hypothetical protein
VMDDHGALQYRRCSVLLTSTEKLAIGSRIRPLSASI